MWLVLADRLFILYAGMAGLQALYLGYFSGEAFRWPSPAAGRALMPYAWNVPVALSCAMACLFAREIAELRHASPRVYGARLARGGVRGSRRGERRKAVRPGARRSHGREPDVPGHWRLRAGVAFLAWRRGNRAAGWFLFAWVLLETFSIVTSARLLFTRAASNEALLYYGLPGSTLASAILTSLGVADGLRRQRHALTEAERRAKTDPSPAS